MTINLFLATALLAVSPAHAQKQGVEEISQFKGLHTTAASLVLEKGEAQAATNVVFDETTGVRTRRGQNQINSTAIGGSLSINQLCYFQQSDGDRYTVAFSSTQGYYSTDGGATFTAFISTLTANQDIECAAFQDRLYFTNAIEGLNYFDGSDDVNVGLGVTPKYIKVFKNRLWAAGDSSNPSTLYFSGLGNGNSWNTTLDNVVIDSQNGDDITCLGDPIYSKLPVYKAFSTHMVRAFSPALFRSPNAIQQISSSIGCKSHRSARNFKGVQLFASVGPGGGRAGIYANDGLKITKLTERIDKEIAQLDNFISVDAKKIIETKDDFEAGSFDAFTMTASSITGIMRSSWTLINELNFVSNSSGTNFSTGTNPGQVLWSPSTHSAFANAGAEDNNLTTNWTETTTGADNTIAPTTSAPCDGSYSFFYNDNAGNVCGYNFDAIVKRVDNTEYQRLSHGLSDGQGCTSNSIELDGTNAGQIISVRFEFTHSLLPGQNVVMQSDQFLRGDRITYTWKDGNGDAGKCVLSIDMNEELDTTGNFVTEPYDIGITTPIWGQFNVKMTSSTSFDIDFTVQSSTASDGDYDALATQLNGENLQAGTSRFVKVKMDFTVTDPVAAAVGGGSVDSLNFTASSTGTWESGQLFLSNDVATWGLFQCIEDEQGATSEIFHEMRAASTAAGLASETYESVSCDSTIGISTNAYVQVRSSFNVVAATDIANLDRLTINWTDSAASQASVAEVYGDRYWFCGQDRGSTLNNTCYILDDEGNWSKFTNVFARSIEVVDQRLVVGTSSNTSGGILLEQNTGNSDLGVGIPATWKSKDLVLSKVEETKSIDALYLIYASSSTSLNGTLTADGVRTSTFTVNLATGSPFGVTRVDFANSLNGQYFNLQLDTNQANEPWEILGLRFYFRPLGLLSR